MPVGTAHAIDCGPPPPNNWHTGFAGGAGYVGASAIIATRPVNLCTGPSYDKANFGTGYVMVTNGCGWAQAGFMDHGFGTQHYIQEVADCESPELMYTKFSKVISPNVAYTYKVQLASGYPACWEAACFHFYWGSNRVDHETGWSPTTSWGGYSRVEYSGETSYAETKMPGTNSSRMSFSTMRGQYTSWAAVPCNQLVASNVQQYGWSHLTSLYNSCQNFDVWSD